MNFINSKTKSYNSNKQYTYQIFHKISEYIFYEKIYKWLKENHGNEFLDQYASLHYHNTGDLVKKLSQVDPDKAYYMQSALDKGVDEKKIRTQLIDILTGLPPEIEPMSIGGQKVKSSGNMNKYPSTIGRPSESPPLYTPGNDPSMKPHRKGISWNDAYGDESVN